MKYPSEIITRVEHLLQERRSSAEQLLHLRKERLEQEYTAIHQLSMQLGRLGAELGRRSIANANADNTQYVQQMDDISKEIIDQLEAAGLPRNFLDCPYTCQTCRDRGIYRGSSCTCRLQLLNSLTYKALSDVSSADDCTFDNFDITYYPEQSCSAMQKLLKACMRYAEGFTLQSKSLLFMGSPGLGKTHLSLAIAHRVVDQGRYVLYASAVRLLDRLVEISFNQDMDKEYKEIVYQCDLLILDDLGTEFQTRLTRSEVYNILNSRHNEGRPTIINTNLTLQELQAAYEDRGFSRLLGYYESNIFSGKDIRMQKRYGKGV